MDLAADGHLRGWGLLGCRRICMYIYIYIGLYWGYIYIYIGFRV